MQWGDELKRLEQGMTQNCSAKVQKSVSPQSIFNIIWLSLCNIVYTALVDCGGHCLPLQVVKVLMISNSYIYVHQSQFYNLSKKRQIKKRTSVQTYLTDRIELFLSTFDFTNKKKACKNCCFFLSIKFLQSKIAKPEFFPFFFEFSFN